jgi:hypothetical protein
LDINREFTFKWNDFLSISKHKDATTKSCAWQIENKNVDRDLPVELSNVSWKTIFRLIEKPYMLNRF